MSYQTQTSPSTTSFTVTFPILSLTDIKAVGKNTGAADWSELAVTNPTSISGVTTCTVTDAPNYDSVRIYRSTGNTALVDFQNGSRLSERDLDTAYNHSLFAAQEIKENANDTAMTKGDTGAAGAAGADGADGVDGANGADGADGADAVITDELHINSTASGNTLHTLLKLETDGTADGSGITIDTRTAHTRGEINFLDGTGSYDSNYVFKTATGSQLATPTEKFRVTPTGATVTGDLGNTGDMFIGTTSSIEDRKLSILYSRASQAGVLIKNGDSAYAAVHMTFQNTNGTVGTITVDGTSTSYATSSDYRLKENVDYTFDATTRLKQLKPARFNFIADADKTVDGFIAHEVSSVVPEAVTGEKDATEMQGIDQSKLVPLLVKTIQELEARITELENPA